MYYERRAEFGLSFCLVVRGGVFGRLVECGIVDWFFYVVSSGGKRSGSRWGRCFRDELFISRFRRAETGFWFFSFFVVLATSGGSFRLMSKNISFIISL